MPCRCINKREGCDARVLCHESDEKVKNILVFSLLISALTFTAVVLVERALTG